MPHHTFTRRRLSFALLGLALLPACTSLRVMSHVPLSTMSRLAALKPANVDPRQLRVAAQLPAALEPRRNGVKVLMTLSGKTSKATATHDFILEPARDDAETEAVAIHAKESRRLWVYRLSARDAERLDQVIRAASSATDLTISAGVDACHRGPLGQAALPTTTLLRTDRSGYFVLVDDLDLRVLVPADRLASHVPPCDP